MQFQRDQGLPVDGVVDLDTWRVMLALVDRLPAGGPATATTPAPPATAPAVATTAPPPPTT